MTISELLRAAGERHGDRLAIETGGFAITHGDLAKEIRRVIGVFRSAGIEEGERIGVCVASKYEFLRISFGAICGGFVVVPFDREGPEAQSLLLEKSDPAAVVHDGSLDLEPSAYSQIRFIETAATYNGSPAGEWHEGSEDAAAAILFTSGTQGERTGVTCTHGNLAATARYISAFMGLDETVREYVASPIDHAFGFGRCRSVLINGGCLVLDDRPFNPMRALHLLKAENCNAFSAASTGYALLLEHLEKHFLDLGEHIRWMEIGSVPMSRHHIEQLCAGFPTARIVMNYGMTEAQRSTLIDFNREHDKVGTVGRPSPGTRIRVRDESGAVVPAGITGIIESAGPHVAKGYWRNEEKWARRFHGGWFETDDFGMLDDDGYLTFVGRRDDMINLGGDKISPVEIEGQIMELLADFEFCICAANDPEDILGEIPVLCLEDGSPDRFDWAEFRANALQAVPNRLLPRLAVEVPKIPRTGNGKIQRKALRRMVETGEAVKL